VIRTLWYGGLLIFALVLHPSISVGDERSHRMAAENLLIVMEVDKSLPKIAEQVVENQIQQNPQLAPQREVFYKTPLGKKANEKMPQLAFIAGQIGLKKAQANQAELRQMVEEQKGKQGGG